MPPATAAFLNKITFGIGPRIATFLAGDRISGEVTAMRPAHVHVKAQMEGRGKVSIRKDSIRPFTAKLYVASEKMNNMKTDGHASKRHSTSGTEPGRCTTRKD